MSIPIPLPMAPSRYDQRDEDRTRSAVAQRFHALEQKPSLHHMASNRGDNNFTLNADQDVPLQPMGSVLTANRVVTLGTGFAGAWFRVVRSGLGAFTVDVGGLKTIPAGTAAIVEVGHDGTQWFLTLYAPL